MSSKNLTEIISFLSEFLSLKHSLPVNGRFEILFSRAIQEVFTDSAAVLCAIFVWFRCGPFENHNSGEFRFKHFCENYVTFFGTINKCYRNCLLSFQL